MADVPAPYKHVLKLETVVPVGIRTSSMVSLQLMRLQHGTRLPKEW
jgi:hypothetical protein